MATIVFSAGSLTHAEVAVEAAGTVAADIARFHETIADVIDGSGQH